MWLVDVRKRYLPKLTDNTSDCMERDSRLGADRRRKRMVAETTKAYTLLAIA